MKLFFKTRAAARSIKGATVRPHVNPAKPELKWAADIGAKARKAMQAQIDKTCNATFPECA